MNKIQTRPSLAARISRVVKSWMGGPGDEGSWRGPFFGQGELGGWYELGRWEDGFQRNLRVGQRNAVAATHAAVSLYVNAMGVMPMVHYRGLERVTASAFLRFLRAPNDWQTWADWVAEGERVLMHTGNVVGMLRRNQRTEVEHIVWATHWAAHTDPVTGAVFYSLRMPQQYGQHDEAQLVPARNVLHLRINVDGQRDPLRGRSHLEWCAAAQATNSTLSAFLVHWLQNRASPSYILSTDLQLNAAQMVQLREAWDNQSKKLAAGGTPILTNGLKPHAMGVSPGDDLLIDTFNLSVADIARAFGVPKALLGIDETAANAAQLISEWVRLALGAHVNMWERALERAFEFSPEEHIEFDADALLRLDPQGEATRLKELVTGGILSIDEGRAALSVAPVPGGHGKMPSQQQQQVPIDLLHDMHAATLEAKVSAPAPAPAPANPPDDAEDNQDEGKQLDAEVLRKLVEHTIMKAKQHA